MMDMVRIDKRINNRFVAAPRSMPDDFAKMAKTMNRYQLVKHYKTSDKAVVRWSNESGVMPVRTTYRPVPADWEILCSTHTAAELTRLLHADIKVIKRWIKETEIEPVPYDRKTMQAPPPRKPFKQIGSPHKAIISSKPRSIWDDAADVLRAERWIVFRCGEGGAADVKGKFWRVGNTVATPDEMLARADKYRRRAA